MDNEISIKARSPRGRTEHLCTYDGCNAVFAKNSKLQYHMRRHTGERPFVCEEPNCNKTYLYSFHLRRHQESHSKTTPVQRIRCPHEGCYLELANKYSLKKHIKRKHDSNRIFPVSCYICKQGFFKKRQLIEHTYVHTGILPFKCDKCGTRFSSLYDRNKHMRTHSAYPCICGETFYRWSELLRHKKICGKISNQCNICGHAFKKATYLQRHLKLHLSDGTKKFHCGVDDCSRVYEHKNNLIYHIKIYHKRIVKTRLYCGYPDCEQNFNRKQNLILHIEREHTNAIKVKKPRRPRKDKGVKHPLDMNAVLAGLNFTIEKPKSCRNKKTTSLVTSTTSIAETVDRNL